MFVYEAGTGSHNGVIFQRYCDAVPTWFLKFLTEVSLQFQYYYGTILTLPNLVTP